jgi:hypothetical protein
MKTNNLMGGSEMETDGGSGGSGAGQGMRHSCNLRNGCNGGLHRKWSIPGRTICGLVDLEARAVQRMGD